MSSRKRKHHGPKILTVDIETLPITTYNWSLFDEPRALDRLVNDWAIASYAAKWLHSSRLKYFDNSRESSAFDDLKLLESLHDLLSEADIVVGQNFRKFDIRKIRARMLQHKMPPFREPAIIDTLEMARGIGQFTSNRLEYLAPNLVGARKGKHKRFPGFALWRALVEKDPLAWKECQEYNILDVKITEQVYLALRPWAKRLPNLAQWYDDDEERCPRCGELGLEDAGVVHVGVSTYRRTLCPWCEGYSRSRYTLNSQKKRRGLLTCL